MHQLEQPMLPLTPLVSSVTRSRQLLREFAARSDIFMVPKRRSQPEIVAYGLMTRALLALERHGTPIDPTVERAIDPAVATLMQQRLPFPPEMHNNVDDTHFLGPYAKYRWWDGPHHSTISLGTLADDPPYPFTPDGV